MHVYHASDVKGAYISKLMVFARSLVRKHTKSILRNGRKRKWAGNSVIDGAQFLEMFADCTHNFAKRIIFSAMLF